MARNKSSYEWSGEWMLFYSPDKTYLTGPNWANFGKEVDTALFHAFPVKLDRTLRCQVIPGRIDPLELEKIMGSAPLGVVHIDVAPPRKWEWCLRMIGARGGVGGKTISLEEGTRLTEEIMGSMRENSEKMSGHLDALDEVLQEAAGDILSKKRVVCPEGIRPLFTEDKVKVRDQDGRFVVWVEDPLPRPLYVQLDRFLKKMGGRWDKRKAWRGHVLDDDPRPHFAKLSQGIVDVMLPEYGFFETPPEVIDKMIGIARALVLPDAESWVRREYPGGSETKWVEGWVESKVREMVTPFLEPSAGLGAIAHKVVDEFSLPADLVRLVEINHTRVKALKAEAGKWIVHPGDFLSMGLPHFGGPSGFGLVAMNPPFGNLAEIPHIQHAYGLLRPGGVLISVVSASAHFQTTKKAKEFRAWLESIGGQFHDLPSGSFKASGTAIETKLISLRKEKE